MTRSHRLETVLVLVIVLVTATYVRYLYIPPSPELQVAASEDRFDYDVGRPLPWFAGWSIGDGQAYVLIALDPSGGKLDEEIPDSGYRFARAGYGWAVWVVSLGRSELIPYGLALIGTLSVIGCLVAAALLRGRLGSRCWLIVLNPALFLGFGGDTSEPMGILFLTISLGWASWLAAAFLGVTRPTFAVSLWGKWKLLVACVSMTVAVGLYGLAAFGLDSTGLVGGRRIGLPFVAYFEQWSIQGVLLLAFAVATLIIGVIRRDLAWVLAGLFVTCFGSDVLRIPLNAWRAAGFLPVMWAFGPGWNPPDRRQRTLHPGDASADVA